MRVINCLVVIALAAACSLQWAANAEVALEVDPNGYIVYCPCMGRFGNQAEQFLGSLQFAKHLNRTLILPPFIEYVKYEIKFTPFDDYIDVDRLREYHRVVLFRDFMEQLAPQIWKEENRTIFCYASRDFGTSSSSSSSKPPVNGCNPFEGSPFREFWRGVGVADFAGGSVFYGPLHTDFTFAGEWTAQFSPQSRPVLAFVGAPSAFPTNSKAVQLQKYVHFSRRMVEASRRHRERLGFARAPYLAVHIRHGTDWSRACELIKSNADLKTLFSSQQCLNGDNYAQSGPRAPPFVTYDLCLPSAEQLVASIRYALDGHNAYRHPEAPIQYLYIATDLDNRALWTALHDQLNREGFNLTLITPSETIHVNGTVTKHPLNLPSPPHFMVDLHLLSTANVFLGNCISSFSAFASRYRLYNLHFEQSTHFFAVDRPLKVRRLAHDEL